MVFRALLTLYGPFTILCAPAEHKLLVVSVVAELLHLVTGAQRTHRAKVSSGPSRKAGPLAPVTMRTSLDLAVLTPSPESVALVHLPKQ